MSAINALTYPGIFVFQPTCCECVRDHAYVLVTRVPVVSARWNVEVESDGSRRLVEHWAANRHAHESGEDSELPGSRVLRSPSKGRETSGLAENQMEG